MRSFNFNNGFKQNFPIKTYSINKTHALLHTKNIPRVLYNIVEFYHFEKIYSHDSYVTK